MIKRNTMSLAESSFNSRIGQFIGHACFHGYRAKGTQDYSKITGFTGDVIQGFPVITERQASEL